LLRIDRGFIPPIVVALTRDENPSRMAVDGLNDNHHDLAVVVTEDGRQVVVEAPRSVPSCRMYLFFLVLSACQAVRARIDTLSRCVDFMRLVRHVSHRIASL
jgi:hypothetical protein